MSGPHAPSVVAAQQKLHRSSPAVRAAVVRVAQDARKLKLACATVSKFAQAEEYPEMHHPKRGEKRSILNPYKRYISDRWQHGGTNGVQIYDEIKTRGFTGSAALLEIGFWQS